MTPVAESIEVLERRIDELRTAIRRAAIGGDRVRARALRGDLRHAEHDWEEALADLEEQAPPGDERPAAATPAGGLLPIREQVHQALTLLSVPAAPKLITEVHAAFFAGQILGARLTSLRRDEERSFQSAPFARPYYICATLSADLLAPVRGLLSVSTWPMDRRIVGPLSPRVALPDRGHRGGASTLLGCPIPGRRPFGCYGASPPTSRARRTASPR